MARLLISSPDGKRGILELNKPELTIGRGNANDLVLNDGSVSRSHAVIRQKNDSEFSIADRGSTNRALLNGHPIHSDSLLKNGDAIRIGVYEITFESINESGLVVSAGHAPLNEAMLQRARDSFNSRENTAGSRTDLVSTIKRLERENYLLSVLYDAGCALNSKLSFDHIAEQVMSLSFRIHGVERGFIMLFDENGEIERQTEVRYRRPPGKEQPQIILGRSILQRIKDEQTPFLISDVSTDARFNASESIVSSGLRSAMCAPLLGNQRILGVLYVDNLEKTAAFEEAELNVFALVAAQAAAAIDNAETHDQLAQQAVERSALERFLSPDLVEMISANDGVIKLGGEHQKVTILFSDIRGFTSLSERLKAETVIELLNEYFTRVTDVIFAHSGTLDKYIGDAVMAVFGAPISKPTDAENAVRTAIGIQRAMLEMNRHAAERGLPELRIGIGVNTGVVTAGNIGSPRRLEYTVVGDAVNIASRLMSCATAGQILISASTADELVGGPELAPLPPLRVKGKTEAINAFSVRWNDKEDTKTGMRERRQAHSDEPE